MFRILAFMCLVLSSHGASNPFVQRCKIDDNACLLPAARAALPIFVVGVPELGIKSMDPMHIPLIKSDHSGLKLEFKNATITGTKSCTIENIEHDQAKLNQSITLKCDLVVSGDYKLQGQLMILPIEGEGKFKIDIRDIVFMDYIEVTPVTLSGATHWHIKNWHQTFKVLTGATFDFENLFNGNKVLADQVLEFANKNWNDIMHEIAPPIVNACSAKFVEGIEALYAAVPVDELVKQ